MPEESQNLEPAFTVPVTVQKPENAFFGRFGMRAGWSLAIFLPLAIFLGMICAGFVGLVASGQLKGLIAARTSGQHYDLQALPSVAIGQDGTMFFTVLLICWFFSKAERRKLGVYGLGANRVSDIVPGAIVGVLVMSIFIFCLHALHVLVFAGRALSGASIAIYGMKWLIAFFLVGFGEEYLFRGYIQYTLTRGLFGLGEMISPVNARAIAFWFAAIIWSAAFGAVHASNGGETLAGLIAVVAAGLTFSYVLWHTGSLWWAIGLHATWDWAQSFLFGVADSGEISVGRLFVTHPAGKPILSGGSVGPEGSIFVLPALLLIILIVTFTSKRGVQPPLEQEQASLPPESIATVA